ncbi:MAG: transposase, partial [Cyanobacteria bacterium J06560_5]
KTAKHQFGLHCFGQGTKIGVYRWLILSLIAYLLAHWIDLWAWPSRLDWKATARLTLEKLLPSVLWARLLRQIRNDAEIAAHYGFEIFLKPSSDMAYQEWCKM